MGAQNPLKGPRGKISRDASSEADGMEGKYQMCPKNQILAFSKFE